MKLILAGLVLLVVGTQAQWYKFPSQAYQGSRDMYRAYTDMKKARDVPHADKYFHARGNYDAANRGAGGRFAARVISDAREGSQRISDIFEHGDSGHGRADSAADQEANRWGRSGGDPNRYRPKNLPSEYRR